MPPPHNDFRQLWSLDPAVTFLNHGSFGACPLAVLEAQRRFRDQMERQPLRFFVRELEPLLDAARTELAGFIGAQPQDVAFVPNATAGVNAVLRSLAFAPGDELLTTDHEYNACRNVLNFVAERCSAEVIVAAVPFPLDSPEQTVAAIMQHVSPRTRLALLDHVTSQTGLVLPIAELVGRLAERGVDTLVDGAHAPGMVPLDVKEIGAAYYTGNCHKWLCVPKGAGFLHVRREKQGMIRPVSISHGANSPRTDRSRFLLEFDWTGTDDPSPYLCIPEALHFMGGLLPGGWPALMAHNRRLALAARHTLCDALGVPPPCPKEMIGALASVPLPDGSPEPPRSPLYLDPLQDALLERYSVEVPIIPWPAPPKRLIRISAQMY
ncbi:MAG TPA: aminotransferase class V-fold PLP-dependent enzyme, partial [Phycisphaerae bacterium]